jgi:hypothetical protein
MPHFGLRYDEYFIKLQDYDECWFGNGYPHYTFDRGLFIIDYFISLVEGMLSWNKLHFMIVLSLYFMIVHFMIIENFERNIYILFEDSL